MFKIKNIIPKVSITILTLMLLSGVFLVAYHSLDEDKQLSILSFIADLSTAKAEDPPTPAPAAEPAAEAAGQTPTGETPPEVKVGDKKANEEQASWFWNPASSLMAYMFDLILKGISSVANLLIFLLGAVLTLLAKILITMMAYSGFVNAPAVTKGWTILRNLSNIFFVVIMLAISIATILRIESYNYKRLLPKLLLMAVLINFSRTICGLIIDAAQVAMMSFAATFAGPAGSGGSALYAALGVPQMVNNLTSGYADAESGAVTWMTVAATSVFAVIMMLIAVIVVAVMLAIILFRIIILWILVTLSPLAFILAAFPQGQQYAQRWWQEFSKYVIIGPILAFFLWLTFAIATPDGKLTIGDPAIQSALEQEATTPIVGEGGSTSGTSDIFTAIAKTPNFLNFLIAIAMLLGSLYVTMQLGVAGSSLAGAAFSKIKSAPGQAGRFAAKLGIGAAALPFQYAARRINERIGEGKMSPLWNPKAMARSYMKRREGLHESAKSTADAAALEVWERAPITGTGGWFRRGISAPHRSGAVSAEEDKYIQEYKAMGSKEEVADMAAKLIDMPETPENDARRRAVIRYAGSQGYIDDIMGHEKVKEWMKKNFEKRYAEDKEFKQYADLTGLMDRHDEIAYDTTHLFLQDYIGKNEDGQNAIYDLNAAGDATKHAEYRGHSTYNVDTGKTEEQKLWRTDESGNITSIRGASQRESEVEYSKKDRNRMNYAPHSFFRLKGGKAVGMDFNTGFRKFQNAFFGQGGRIGEHGQQRMIYLGFGGTQEGMNWARNDDGSYKTVAVKDKEGNMVEDLVQQVDVDKKNLESTKHMIAMMGHASAADMEKTWRKAGGRTAKPNFIINGEQYSMDQLMKEYSMPELTKAYDDDVSTRARAAESGNVVPSADVTASPVAASGLRPQARMSDPLEEQRYNATKNKIDEYRAIDPDFDFYNSKEYWDNQDQYLDQRRLNQLDEATSRVAPSDMRGVTTAMTTKEGARQAGVGLDFNNEEIRKVLGVQADQRAAYFDAGQKDKAAEAIGGVYRKQLTDTSEYLKKIQHDVWSNFNDADLNLDDPKVWRGVYDSIEDEGLRGVIQKRAEDKAGGKNKFYELYNSNPSMVKSLLRDATQEIASGKDTDDNVQRLVDGLKNAKTIRLRNNASTGNIVEDVKHERAHAKIDNLTDSQVNKAWNSIPRAQRNAIAKDIKKRYGKDISEENLMREGLAEMATGKGIYQANDATRKSFRRLGLLPSANPEADLTKLEKYAKQFTAKGSAVGNKVASGLRNSIFGIYNKLEGAAKSVDTGVRGRATAALNSIKEKRVGKAANTLLFAQHDLSDTRVQMRSVQDKINERYERVYDHNEQRAEKEQQMKQALDRGEDFKASEIELSMKLDQAEIDKVKSEIKELSNEMGKLREAERKQMDSVVKADRAYRMTAQIPKASVKEKLERASNISEEGGRGASSAQEQKLSSEVERIKKELEQMEKKYKADIAQVDLGILGEDFRQILNSRYEPVIRDLNEKLQNALGTTDQNTASSASSAQVSGPANQNNRVRERIIEQLSHEEPPEVILAGREKVEEESNRALKATSNDEVVSALNAIENTLNVISTTLSNNKRGEIDAKFLRSLKSDAGQVNSYKNSMSSGGSLDPASLQGLLKSVNESIKMLNKNVTRLGKQVNQSNKE